MNNLKWYCGLILMFDLVIAVLVVEGQDEEEIVVLTQLCSSVSCRLKRKKAEVSWRTLEEVYLDACCLLLKFWY
jgi:hypothetical protein